MVPLDHARLPNFSRYAGGSIKNPTHDPGNRYTVVWQSGITAIGYDPRLTCREITSVHDLFDPAFKGKVGMLTDTVTLPLIVPGIVAATLMGFALSIDDYIITSFVAGQTLTFPLWVYGAVKVGIPPQVFVMGTLIFLGGVLLAIASVIAQRRGRTAAA